MFNDQQPIAKNQQPSAIANVNNPQPSAVGNLQQSATCSQQSAHSPIRNIHQFPISLRQ